MNRASVSSSNLASVGYDEATSTLEVEFNNGLVYQYYGVPPNVHDELMGASSHGVYFSNSIKNSYSYSKV